MRDRARVVVIGGGVGGCAILYWLTKLGWRRRRARRARRPDERLHLPLGRPRRPAARLAQPDEDDDGARSSCTARSATRSGSRRAGTRSARSGSRRREERMEELRAPGRLGEDVRPAAGADLGRGGAAAVPADVDGRRPRRGLPPDRRLHRPEPAHLRAGRGRPARRRRDRHEHARDRDRASSASRVRGVETDRGRIETEIVVERRRDVRGRARARSPASSCPVVPMAHEYLITRPAGLPLDLPTMRDPSLLVYFRGESGGLVMGGYERNPAPWGLDGIPRGLQRQACSRRTGSASRS